MNLINVLKNIVKKEDDKLDFEKIAMEWLLQKKIGIKESTYAKYEYMINRYLLPNLKDMKMEELQKYNFNELVVELMEDLSAKSIRDILCILKAILYYANDEYGCNFKIKKITSPKLDIENIVIMSKREKSRLENYCIKDNSLKALGIVICLNTGLRIGEICALKWENINLDKRTLSVKNTISGTDIYTVNIDNVNTKNMAMNTGIENSVQLTGIILPSNSNEDILWKSEDTTILQVDSDGNLIGIEEGTTKLLAKSSISGKKDEVEITVTTYGEPVDYSVEIEGITLDNWKILYKEDGNTFIIYGDYLPNAVLGDGTEGTIKYWTKMLTSGTYFVRMNNPTFQNVNNYTLKLFKGTEYGLNSSYNNSKWVSSLLNTENWSTLLTNELKNKVENDNVKAIGSPTIEMWSESWNDVYPRILLDYRKKPLDPNNSSDTSYGYQVKANTSISYGSLDLSRTIGHKNKLYFPRTASADDGCWGYWLASPSSYSSYHIMYVPDNGHMYPNNYGQWNYNRFSIRPVICISSDILKEKDTTGKWQLNLD